MTDAESLAAQTYFSLEIRHCPAQADTQIHAFCKVSETRHDFVRLRLRYVKEVSLPPFYSPDFLVRTGQAVYLVETKAQGQVPAGFGFMQFRYR